jgi:signal transduction histidine kinase
MFLPDRSRQADKFYRIFLRILSTVHSTSWFVFLLSVSFTSILSWIFTNSTLFLILGIIFILWLIHDVLTYLYAPKKVFLAYLYPLKKQFLKFKDLISSYLVIALITFFVVGYVGLHMLQLSIEVVYLVTGMIAIGYSTIGYIFFIRNRQKLEQLLRTVSQ